MHSHCTPVEIGLFLLVVGVVAAIDGCRWGGDEEGPVNPATRLEVTSTYPPDGGIGPYDLFTARPESVKPHFTVHFNRAMKLSSLDQTTVSCAGFGEATTVRVLNHVPRDGDIVGFQVRSEATGAPLVYDINGVYTVTVQPTVEDYQGGRLGHEVRFTFRPEPYFRVTGFSFGHRDTLVPPAIEIFFNSRLPSAIGQAITIEPYLTDVWSFDAATDSSSVIFEAFGRVVPSTSYSVRVAATATDTRNNRLHEAVVRSFYSPPLVITQNQFGSAGVNLSAQIILGFNYPMDIPSIAAAFHLEPSTVLVQEVEQQRLAFYAASDFTPDADYVITLSTQLTTVSGYALPSPKIIAFHTAPFAMTHHPADSALGVSIHNVVELDFTGAIVPSSATGAISVSPPTGHHLTFSEGTPGKYITIFLVPDGLLSAFTTYTVVVSNVIESVGGYHAAAPDTFMFRTGGS